MIFDSNVLIYLSKYQLNPDIVLKEPVSISVITKIETLGFRFSNVEEFELLSSLCKEFTIIPLSDAITNEAIRLRRSNRVQLADAIIYATAVVENTSLVTNNMADFVRLDGNVELIDPFTL